MEKEKTSNNKNKPVTERKLPACDKLVFSFCYFH